MIKLAAFDLEGTIGEIIPMCIEEAVRAIKMHKVANNVILMSHTK